MWKGGGVVVRIEAAKVICQHMFFFTLSYIPVKIFEIKKKMIGLVLENHDEMAKCPTLFQWF